MGHIVLILIVVAATIYVLGRLELTMFGRALAMALLTIVWAGPEVARNRQRRRRQVS